MNVRIRARVSNFRVISDVHLKTDHCLPSWAYAKGSSTVCVCVHVLQQLCFPLNANPPPPPTRFVISRSHSSATGNSSSSSRKKRHRHLYMMPQPLSRLPNPFPLPSSRTRSTCSTTAASGVSPRGSVVQRLSTCYYNLLRQSSFLPPIHNEFVVHRNSVGSG